MSVVTIPRTIDGHLPLGTKVVVPFPLPEEKNEHEETWADRYDDAFPPGIEGAYTLYVVRHTGTPEEPAYTLSPCKNDEGTGQTTQDRLHSIDQMAAEGRLGMTAFVAVVSQFYLSGHLEEDFVQRFKVE